MTLLGDVFQNNTSIVQQHMIKNRVVQIVALPNLQSTEQQPLDASAAALCSSCSSTPCKPSFFDALICYAKRGLVVTFPTKGTDGHCGHTPEVLEPHNNRKWLFTTPWRAGATRLLTGLPASQRSPTAPLRALLGGQSPGRPGRASPPPTGRLAARCRASSLLCPAWLADSPAWFPSEV